MKKSYQKPVIRLCLFLDKDVLTISGETDPDGLIVDREWGGIFEWESNLNEKQ